MMKLNSKKQKVILIGFVLMYKILHSQSTFFNLHLWHAIRARRTLMYAGNYKLNSILLAQNRKTKTTFKCFFNYYSYCYFDCFTNALR